MRPLASTCFPGLICMKAVGLTKTIGGLYGCVSSSHRQTGMLYVLPASSHTKLLKQNKKLDNGKPLWLAENVAAAGRHLEMDSPYSHYFPTCHPSAMTDSATPSAHFGKKLPTWHPLKKWTRPTSLPATPQLMDSAALRAHIEKFFPNLTPLVKMDQPYCHYFPTCHPSAIMDSATLVGDALSQCNDGGQ